MLFQYLQIKVQNFDIHTYKQLQIQTTIQLLL